MIIELLKNSIEKLRIYLESPKLVGESKITYKEIDRVQKLPQIQQDQPKIFYRANVFDS